MQYTDAACKIPGLCTEKSLVLRKRIVGKYQLRVDVKPGAYMSKPLCSGKGVAFYKQCLNALKY